MLFVTALEGAPLLTTFSCTLKIYKCLDFNTFCIFYNCYGFKYPAVQHAKKLNEKLAACTASLEYVIRHTAGCARNSPLSKEGMDITSLAMGWFFFLSLSFFFFFLFFF